MTKEQEALDNFLKEYLFLCEKLNTNMQEKMLLDSNSPYNILKQSFEKAPEPIQTGIDLGVIKPKKYLKWEDLEFMRDEQEVFVLLNGTKYTLEYYRGGTGVTYVIISLNNTDITNLCGKFNADQQFFNNLHLEVVE